MNTHKIKSERPLEVKKELGNITNIGATEQYVCDLESDNQILRLLLSEAYRRFKQYEMDVDDTRPEHHINFMEQVEAVLAV